MEEEVGDASSFSEGGFWDSTSTKDFPSLLPFLLSDGILVGDLRPPTEISSSPYGRGAEFISFSEFAPATSAQ